MKTNWISYFNLPLNVREAMYRRSVDDEVKNFLEFEKSLREEPEEEEILEFSESQNGKITIVKGDDPVMNEYNDLELNELLEIFAEEEFEFEKVEKELPKEAIEALKRAYKVLLKYKDSMNEDLKRAMTVITRYIGVKYPESYPVKKSEKEPKLFNWKSFIGNMEEKAEEDQEFEEDIEKSDSDRFPTLTRGLLKGQKKREKAQTERDLERRFI